ncbi:MAG: NAD-dependent deacylase [Bacteroidales bacterium]|nr:NAD-dependent deacylase [Bacteroidales bacterium]
MKTVVVLTGAGISAESGIKTFRDDNGLWRNYRFEEVASPHAWAADPELVLEFYNLRRKQLLEVHPNPAHYALAKLQEFFDVKIVTQNVDDLHERAGSRNVLHLHGELRKARSTADDSLVTDIDGWVLNLGDMCSLGSQLRPHVVWFGEITENIVPAIALAEKADAFIIVGTSLRVYPAANLISYTPRGIPMFFVDPQAQPYPGFAALQIIKQTAGSGVPMLVDHLIEEYSTQKNAKNETPGPAP